MSALGVVHVYKGCGPVHGGIEGHIDLLTRLLAERGLRPEIVCARPPGTAAYEDRGAVHIRRCTNLMTLASAPLPPGLPAALWRSPADLVHLHFPWPPGEVAWLLGGRGRPLVVTVHCEVVRYPLLRRLVAPLTGAVLRAAARIVVSGPFMRAAAFLAPHRDRLRVVPYGVDLERFHPDPGGSDPLPHVPHPRVIFVGRLRYYKGLPVLAAALVRLPQAQLIVAGDGPQRRVFEDALHAAGCRARVHLLGDVAETHLVRLLQTADAAVLPSTSSAEAFGLAIAEAQACGVPAVTTEVGTATAYTVADGVSGRVVAPNDSAALAAALAWCLEPDAAGVRRAAARRHAETALCARRMAENIHSVYDEAYRHAHLP